MGRYVIKSGSGLLTKKDGRRDLDVIKSISFQISRLMEMGHSFVYVSSGAVAGDPKKNRTKNLRSMVGQVSLMSEYKKVFSDVGIEIAQLLVSESDLSGFLYILKKFFTIGPTLVEKVILESFEERVLVVVNFNDGTNDSQIKALNRCADNDHTSMSIALMDKLEIDGVITLVDAPGVLDNGGKLVKLVGKGEYNRTVEYANGGSEFGHGKNGMETKIKKNINVAKHGKLAAIINGRDPSSIEEIVSVFEGCALLDSFDKGTIFLP